MTNYDLLNQDKSKKVPDLTVDELFGLMIKAIRECKRQNAEEAEMEYRLLTGTKVPQEY